MAFYSLKVKGQEHYDIIMLCYNLCMAFVDQHYGKIGWNRKRDSVCRN